MRNRITLNLAFLALFGLASAAAGDMYLELGPIKGECWTPGYEETIPIRTFSYLYDAADAPEGRPGRRAAAPEPPSQLRFTKGFDSSSPLILQFLWNGSPLSGNTVLTADLGEGRRMRLILGDVRIAAYSLLGAEAGPQEEVTLGFGSLRVEYQNRDKTDSADFRPAKGK